MDTFRSAGMLRTIRVQAQWTESAVAQWVGATLGYYQRLERGSIPIVPDEIVQALSAVMGRPPVELGFSPHSGTFNVPYNLIMRARHITMMDIAKHCGVAYNALVQEALPYWLLVRILRIVGMDTRITMATWNYKVLNAPEQLSLPFSHDKEVECDSWSF